MKLRGGRYRPNKLIRGDIRHIVIVAGVVDAACVQEKGEERERDKDRERNRDRDREPSVDMLGREASFCCSRKGGENEESACVRV